MKKGVFISGSRGVRELSSEVKQSLSRIMSQNFDVVVGDAWGVDKLVQEYLHEHGYTKVTVYYTKSKPRNNAGFPTKHIVGGQTAKDVAMSQAANYGLAIWDGHSRGTRNNIERARQVGMKMKVITAVTEATTIFCRCGTYPRPNDSRREPVNFPVGLPECSACLKLRTRDELATWNGQAPCPKREAICNLNRSVHHGREP